MFDRWEINKAPGMLWHFRANLLQGSENSATHLWQWELEDVETAQAHMGKLGKNIVPSSIFIACTVKILNPFLLTKLFLRGCNHSSSQLKNHQAIWRTLEGQTVQRASGPGCWDGAVSSGEPAPLLGPALHPCPRGCSRACARPCISRTSTWDLVPPQPAPPPELAQHGSHWLPSPGCRLTRLLAVAC